jgi:hypothetical protein
MKNNCFESFELMQKFVMLYLLNNTVLFKKLNELKKSKSVGLKIFITKFQEFYNNVDKPPRVFGMTASPIIGKGNGVLT